MTTSQAPRTPPTTDNAAAQPFDPELRKAGQLTSPTWELELFLSGALVFATLQLPNVVDRFFAGIEPHVAGNTRAVVTNLSIYAKAIAYTLLITFAVHLIGRANWVGLMGLYSVFPGGIKWDDMKLGPVSRDVYRRDTPGLSPMIAKLDNFCSIVFSIGMLFVMMFVYSAVLVGVLGGLAFGMSSLFGTTGHVFPYFVLLALIFVGIPVTTALVDKKWGDKIDPQSRGYRVLRGFVRFSFNLSIMRIAGPTMWTMMTNFGRTRAMVAMYVGLFGIMVLAAADLLARRGALSVNSYDYFGPSLAHGVTSAHYESQRPASTPPRTPMIQSDIIRDPYVKLFIPYSPQRHNVTLARECPGLKPLQEQGLQVGRDTPVADSLVVPALNCLKKVHAVAVDGVARPDLDFAFYEHPGTGLRGILTYIAVDSLARGRHVITVMPVPPAVLPTDSVTLANAAWKKPYVIPFWK
jgi:hypothetical protein